MTPFEDHDGYWVNLDDISEIKRPTATTEAKILWRDGQTTVLSESAWLRIKAVLIAAAHPKALNPSTQDNGGSPQ